jgi:hypothetical protein
MKLINLVVLFGAASLATACIDGTPSEKGDDTFGTDTDSGDTTADDTDDTDDTMPAGPPMWDTTAWTDRYDAIITCNAGASITIQLRTMNWGFTPRLYLADTRFAGAWSEEHTMEETDVSPDPSGYSLFERTLNIVASANDQDPDVSTILNCERYETGAGDESVTIAAAVYESAGGAQSDCIAFGHDADAVAGDSLPGTAPTFATGDCRNANPN